jgi:hypothetical protein
MIPCDYKPKDFATWTDCDALNNFLIYSAYAIQENERCNCKQTAAAWKRVLNAAADRYDAIKTRTERRCEA